MWKTFKLKEICSVFTDGDWIETKDQSAEGIRLVQTGNVKIGKFADRRDKARYISKETFKRLNCTEVMEGDILVSRLPEPVGRACVIPELQEKAITAVDCTVIRTNDNVSPRYLNYYMQSPQYFSLVQEKVTGATRQRISRKNLGEVLVSLPPLAEQQRIVAKLDAAFAEIDEAINSAEAKETEVQKLKTSLLSSSLNGDAVMWKTVKLGDMLEVQNGYAFNSKQFDVDGDMPLIRIRDLKNAFETETCYTGEYEDKYMVQSGDLLIGMDGEFRCYEWQGGAALLNQRVCRLQNFHADLDQRFLLYAINSELKKIEDVTGFTTVKHLSSNTIKQIELSIPSLAEQQRIVAKLDAANSEFRNVNESIAKSKVNYLALKSAILEQKLKSNEAA